MSTIAKFTKLQMAYGLLGSLIVYAGFIFFGYVAYTFHWIALACYVVFITLFLAVWLFTGGIHAKGMFERGQIDPFLLRMYLPLLFVVLELDVTFNATWGTFIYRELPREWLFTTRTKRHITESKGRQLDAAKRWAFRLNAIDPGHV